MKLRTLIKTIIDSLISFEAFFVSQEKHPGERRVLIMRKDGLGDCLIFFPTFHAYREFYHDAKITLIFPSIFKPLGALLTEADEVIWFDHTAFRTSFSYRRKFMLDLKRRGYDIALYPVYTQEEIAKKMLRMTGAHQIVTFDEVQTEALSELERDCDFAEHVTGKKINVTFPSIVTKLLPHQQDEIPTPYVIVFPGTSFAFYRRWPSERFAEIIETLVTHSLTPVLCGSPKEKDLVQSIIEKLSPTSQRKVINLAGMTDFADLAHLLEKAEFYFGSDTGILHLAVAVGTPAIGIVGSGGFQRFFPYGDPDKNRAVFDPESMKGKFPIGSWEDVENSPDKGPHPSIEAITIDRARTEVEYMLKFLYRK